MEVSRAPGVLRFSKRQIVQGIGKLLLSAIASWEAKSNRKAEDGKLFVSCVFIDEGVMTKHIRSAPQDRGHRIRKRSNHVTLPADTRANDEK